MKIALPREEDNFNITPSKINNKDCFLITPKINAKWNRDNLFYRSLIIDKRGKVLSSGFPKFFNLGEKEDCYPDFNLFSDWYINDKIDGSLVICDVINKKFNMRTRGTVSYISQPNFKDFEELLLRYPKIEQFLIKNTHISLLLELITPNNVIVVRPKDIEFYLLGAVNKEELRLLSSLELTDIWRDIGNIPVPEMYEFGNNKNINDISNYIKNWKGKEGVVLSYNKNQNRIKLKSDWYCFIHRAKSQLNSLDNLISYYVEKEMPQHENFKKLIEEDYDFEIVVLLKDDIEKICNAGTKAKEYIDKILEVVHDIRKFKTRKEQAEVIKRMYQSNSSFVFSILDNKPLINEQWIKLINQKLY